MGKKGTLYQVHAGNKEDGFSVIYETTKMSKADKFVHDLLKEENTYDKVFITSKPLAKYDKRREWVED